MIARHEAAQAYFWMVGSYRMVEGRMRFAGKKAPDFLRDLAREQEMPTLVKLAEMMECCEYDPCNGQDNAGEIFLYAGEWPENLCALLGGIPTENQHPTTASLVADVLLGKPLDQLQEMAKRLFEGMHLRAEKEHRDRMKGLGLVDALLSGGKKAE